MRSMINRTFILPIICLLLFNACEQKEPSDSQLESENSASANIETVQDLTSEDLRNAALNGRMDIVEQAIEQDVDLHETDQLGRTALMFASYNGHTEIVRFLVERGTEISRKNMDGRTSLMFAASGPFPETVEFLLEQGADPNVKDNVEGWTSLMYAAAEGNRDVVQILIDNGADVSLKDTDGETAIDFARNNGHKSVVDLLEKEL